MTSPTTPLPAADPVEQAGLLLMRHARAETWPPDRAAQLRILRRARAAVHPDLLGDRADWDAVEQAARRLGLTPNILL